MFWSKWKAGPQEGANGSVSGPVRRRALVDDELPRVGAVESTGADAGNELRTEVPQEHLVHRPPERGAAAPDE